MYKVSRMNFRKMMSNRHRHTEMSYTNQVSNKAPGSKWIH